MVGCRGAACDPPEGKNADAGRALSIKLCVRIWYTCAFCTSIISTTSARRGSRGPITHGPHAERRASPEDKASDMHSAPQVGGPTGTSLCAGIWRGVPRGEASGLEGVCALKC